MAQKKSDKSGAAAMERATALVSEALDLIDAQGDCPDAAAHLDLALRRLRQKLSGE